MDPEIENFDLDDVIGWVEKGDVEGIRDIVWIFKVLVEGVDKVVAVACRKAAWCLARV